MSEVKPLPRGTLQCPTHKHTVLHFENIHGMRVIRDGVLRARCPECRLAYEVIPDSMPK